MERRVESGFVPVVVGDDVTLQQAGTLVAVARNDLSIRQGGGDIIGAGNSISVSQGGSLLMGAGNRIEVSQGGAGLAAAKAVEVRDAYLGLAIGGVVQVDEGSRVVFGSPLSLGLGLLAGLALGALVTRR